MKLTTAQFECLKAVSMHSKYGNRYRWKLATMAKFEAAGYVKKVEDDVGGYIITEAGREVLQSGR